MISNFGSVNLMILVAWFFRVPIRIAWVHTTIEANILDSNSGILTRFNNKILDLRKKLIYNLCTHIIFNSEATKRQFEKYYRTNTKNKVFYNSLKLPALSSSVVRNGITCIGRFSPCKGHSVLLEAFAKISEVNSHLILDFYGKGPGFDELKKLTNALGLHDRVTFHGQISHDEVFKAFSKALIAVVPSLDEAFGLVVVEAMSMQTPVIASDVGGIPEIIRDDLDGLLVPPGDADALAVAINRLLSDPGLRNKLGVNGRLRVESQFGLESAVAAQYEYFESLTH